MSKVACLSGLGLIGLSGFDGNGAEARLRAGYQPLVVRFGALIAAVAVVPQVYLFLNTLYHTEKRSPATGRASCV